MSNNLAHKLKNRNLRIRRVRSHILGRADRPRLSVNITNIHVSAQLIDDANHRTLAQVTTIGQKSVKGNLTEKSAWVGEEIAKKAKAAKINTVVFDRGSKLYHGRVAALAEAARKAGLEF
jgi:large subunit ribosomal protein L18